MYEVRALGVGTDHLCAPCIEDGYRKGTFDRLTFYRRAGAPAAWLAAHEAELRQGPLLRHGLPPHIWGEILADHLNEVHGSPSGSAHPVVISETEESPPA